MKLSPKTLVPVFAAFAALAFSAPAFAQVEQECIPWNNPAFPNQFMCIPIFTPEIPIVREAPVPPVIPVTPPAPVVIPVPPLDPVISHDNRPFMCHYESTVGFSGPRRSNDLLKDLAVAGNSAIGATGLCDKPAAPSL